MGTNGKKANKLKKVVTALNKTFLSLRMFYLRRNGQRGPVAKHKLSFFPDEDRNARRQSQGRPMLQKKGRDTSGAGDQKPTPASTVDEPIREEQKNGVGPHSRVAAIEENGHDYEAVARLWDDVTRRHERASEEEHFALMGAWYFRNAWTKKEDLSVAELESQGRDVPQRHNRLR